MAISSTKLRENIYQILDEVLRTGRPIEIRRKGRSLRIVPEAPVSRLAKLRKRSTIRGNAEDLVHIDWSGEWKP
jgi:prevent-host-death family protein